MENRKKENEQDPLTVWLQYVEQQVGHNCNNNAQHAKPCA